MRYGDLTFLEIRERAAAGWLAIIPTGCIEQQGPHLPVDFDTWFAETLMLAAADRAAQQYAVNSLVLPALPFGPTPEHRNFGSGYIDVPLDVHHATIRAILDSLTAQGFQRMVIWRGCGGHQLQDVAGHFNAQSRGTARAFYPDWPYQASWCRVADPDVSAGHADSFTTALSLFLRPESVRRDQIPHLQNNPVNWNDPDLDFAQYSTNGVIGDPSYATTEIGAQLWAELLSVTAEILRDIAHTSLDDRITAT
jgi:creatinine amidohydrolase